MSVKKKDGKIELMHNKTLAGIVKSVSEMYQHHSGEIQENLDTSETQKVTVNFSADIDCSETEPLVSVGIRFSKSVTDKRVFRVDETIDVDDPAQIVLFSSVKEANPEKEAEEKTGTVDQLAAE